MDKKQIKNDAITRRSEDFAQWYTDICKKAELMDYSSVKGFIIYRPYGYAIWEEIQNYLNKEFKKTGHQNVYMPTVIPESLFNKEKEHVSGFAPETLICTIGGQTELDDRLIVRPTSEVLFCEHYAKVISSYRDLPKLYNQWCSVVRWEKTTRPFLRGAEFLWQEGHTMHETEEEARTEALQMLEIYDGLGKNCLAVPFMKGRKTEKEKFAGAEYTLTVEALMYNGVSLQSGTSHYFGQKFSKAYDIKFSNRNNELEYAYQTSWGVTTRMIGALIMVHSDDDGLVLPPYIAPTQVMIIPIGDNEEVKTLSNGLCEKLKQNNIRVDLDVSEKSPGFKFAEAEVNGIPIRIEIGARDLENNEITIARRDTKEKIKINKEENIIEFVNKLMIEIQNNLFEQAKIRRDKLTFECHKLEEVEKIMNSQPGFIKAMWCGDEACELKMKEIRGTKSRCILENAKAIDDKCIVCGHDAKQLVLWGIQY